MTQTPDTAPWAQTLRVADLSAREPTRFDLAPATGVLAAIAQDLGLSGLKKLRFNGQVVPLGRRDWQLIGEIGATVVQPCSVTLEPVTTRIDAPVQRLYLAELPEFEPGSEEQMPEDDSVEALPATLDLGAVMVEALALHLPLYPRAPGAELAASVFTEPGKAAMRDADARPFAGLKSLRGKLDKDDA